MLLGRFGFRDLKLELQGGGSFRAWDKGQLTDGVTWFLMGGVVVEVPD